MKTDWQSTEAPVRGQAAFSLVEVMVSMAVVSILFVALYAGISSGFGVVSVARENLRATQVLQDKIEEVRLYNWDQITSFGSSGSFIPTMFTEPYYPPGSSGADAGFVYSGTLLITNAPIADSGYSNDLRLFTVSVTWTNGNVRRERNLSTLISRHGLQNYIY
jgi:prepilin-type N-terminal cleavage/methylation domain-containing protein